LCLGKAYKLGISRSDIRGFLLGLLTSDSKDTELFIRSFGHFIVSLFDDLEDIKFEKLDSELQALLSGLAVQYTKGPVYIRYESNFNHIFGAGAYDKTFSKNEQVETMPAVSVEASASVSVSASASVSVELPKIDSDISTAIADFLESSKSQADFNKFKSELDKVGKYNIGQPMALAFCDAIASQEINDVRVLVEMIDNSGVLKALIKAQDEQVPGLFEDYIENCFCANYRELIEKL
jgi:hypothetical protein